MRKRTSTPAASKTSLPKVQTPAPGDASRREFLKTGAGLVAGAAALPLLPSGPDDGDNNDDEALERLKRGKKDAKHRVLLKGGTIISMDPQVGNFAKGDVLIEGKKILAVGANIEAAGQHIDATDMILIPGFCDPHRHSWEGQLRGLNPNAVTITDYNAYTHQGFGPFYRPHDIYVGNLATALGCIDAGITCIIDNSHNSRTSAHSDAAIQALFDSGIRAVHASGAPQFGDWDHQWPQDLTRLQSTYFSSDDQLVTLRMFSPVNAANWEFARQLGLRITTESNGGAQVMTEVWNEKLLGPDNTYNHCNGWSDDVWKQVRDSGGTVNVCARSDPQYGLGEGIPA